MIAALYVDPNGTYAEVEDVDCWGEDLDARLYDGPWPVVAHPPCARWSTLAVPVQASGGAPVGEDAGCFSGALYAVRRWGGVIEHPAFSLAWAAFGLPKPPTAGGWVRGFCGGWSCYVEQGRYGHPTRKPTYLYAHGAELPSLLWGFGYDAEFLVCASTRNRGSGKPEISGKTRARQATPEAFRDVLIKLARSVSP